MNVEDQIGQQENSPSVSLAISQSQESFPTRSFLLVLFAVALLGIGSGFMLARSGGKVGPITIGKGGESSVPKGTVVGSDDLKTFKDSAEGILEKGGIDGEGQYHLVRVGGESQYVYLTSSIVDLSPFVGVKVKVWGETQKAQKAGWLMDVGRVQVL